MHISTSFPICLYLISFSTYASSRIRWRKAVFTFICSSSTSSSTSMWSSNYNINTFIIGEVFIKINYTLLLYLLVTNHVLHFEFELWNVNFNMYIYFLGFAHQLNAISFNHCMVNFYPCPLASTHGPLILPNGCGCTSCALNEEIVLHWTTLFVV